MDGSVPSAFEVQGRVDGKGIFGGGTVGDDALRKDEIICCIIKHRIEVGLFYFCISADSNQCR